jgi:hypothetical protein
MSGLYQTRRQQERKRVRRRVLILFILLLIAGAAGGGFYYGRKLEMAMQGNLHEQIEALQTAKSELVEGLAKIQDDYDRSSAELTSLQQRYSRDVPEGEVKELAALARERIAEGVPAERLRFLLANADDENECGPVDVKRFRPKTRLTPANELESSVSFANGSIQITATGDPDRDEERNPVSWYDPVQPVDISVAMIGGEVVHVAGTLPQQHTEVAGDMEHRLVFSQGPRSFLLVTYQGCPFP